MKIKFTEDVEVEARLDICCFSGECMHRTLTFKAGDELEVSSVSYGPKIKVKTRPGKPGGRLQKCSVCLQNENSFTTHPDYFVVAADSFEEVVDE